MRVGMIALGCAKNLVDGEVMLGHLCSRGIEITNDVSAADIVIVNTCGFVVEARQESIEAILEIAEEKKSGRIKRLVVAGCMAQVFARELGREIPEIDAFIGLDELPKIVAAARGELDGHMPAQHPAHELFDHAQPRMLSTSGYAYLKIADGCNNPCSFCVIPAIRGPFRSRGLEDLVAEAQALEDRGVKELVLIAQDSTRYGEDLGMKHGLRTLIRTLLDATDVPWIRFLYAYPATLDMGLLELMATETRFLSYLDIPLQHVSRNVLRAMRRGGDAASLAAFIERARSEVPDLVLRSTFIVGFPGEGDPELAELLDFVRAVELDHVGVFTYSFQEENPAVGLGDPITQGEKQRRRARLMSLQQAISLKKNRQLVGRRLPALVAGPLDEMELLTEARLERHAPEIDGRLLINEGVASPGSLVEVEVTEAHPYDVVGRCIRVIASGSQHQALPVVSAGAP